MGISAWVVGSVEHLTLLRDVCLHKRLFFWKKSKRLLTPAPLPIFGFFIALVFAKIRKYALIHINLQ